MCVLRCGMELFEMQQSRISKLMTSKYYLFKISSLQEIQAVQNQVIGHKSGVYASNQRKICITICINMYLNMCYFSCKICVLYNNNEICPGNGNAIM